jgi:hypothetical protein
MDSNYLNFLIDKCKIDLNDQVKILLCSKKLFNSHVKHRIVEKLKEHTHTCNACGCKTYTKHQNVLRAFNYVVFICWSCLLEKTKQGGLLVDTSWLQRVSVMFKIDTSPYLSETFYKNHQKYTFKFLEELVILQLSDGYEYGPQSYAKMIKTTDQIVPILFEYLRSKSMSTKEEIIKAIQMTSLFFLCTT